MVSLKLEPGSYYVGVKNVDKRTSREQQLRLKAMLQVASNAGDVFVDIESPDILKDTKLNAWKYRFDCALPSSLTLTIACPAACVRCLFFSSSSFSPSKVTLQCRLWA